MCGLVGAVARRDVMPVLFGGLRNLEYQDYDSTGVAFLHGQYWLKVHRCVGSVSELENGLRYEGLSSPIGIGHTRRATHGAPEPRNAHPHVSHKDVAVVHNGVIANHECLRRLLENRGYRFRSDTDTEVIAHLIHHQLMLLGSLFEAVYVTTQLLSGSYAVVAMAASEPDLLVATCQDSPLVIGLAEDEKYVASDLRALPSIRQIIVPEAGDVVQLDPRGIRMADADGRSVNRPVRRLEPEGTEALRPQPQAVRDRRQMAAVFPG